MRATHIGLLTGAAAVLGFTIFGFLAWNATTILESSRTDALRRFEEVRARFGSAPPMLHVDDGSQLVPVTRDPIEAAPPPKRLHVLVYRTREQRLVQTAVPLWFYRLKGPAVEYAFRDTGFDPRRLGATADDLERHGPGVVLDQEKASGDRLLIWLE
jgi:hypothetical protein